MPILSRDRMVDLLEPYLADAGGGAGFSLEDIDKDRLMGQLGLFLELLLRWNARTNLTAIRNPEEIVVRHFGESLFTARVLRDRLSAEARVLDFGSGAGFPGLPIQLLAPKFRVTLAESQGKKAAFLREAVRTLCLASEVWAGRVEAMPADRRFECVTLRAVDHMEVALKEAAGRAASGGWMAVLGGAELGAPGVVSGWKEEVLDLPESLQRRLYLFRAP